MQWIISPILTQMTCVFNTYPLSCRIDTLLYSGIKTNLIYSPILCLIESLAANTCKYLFQSLFKEFYISKNWSWSSEESLQDLHFRSCITIVFSNCSIGPQLTVLIIEIMLPTIQNSFSSCLIMQLKNSSINCPLGNLFSAVTSENSSKLQETRAVGFHWPQKPRNPASYTNHGLKFAKCSIWYYGNQIRSTEFPFGQATNLCAKCQVSITSIKTIVEWTF